MLVVQPHPYPWREREKAYPLLRLIAYQVGLECGVDYLECTRCYDSV